MACGGFTCSKNALCALNILYILVGVVLIGVSVYGRTSNNITSVAVIGGIIACGAFLILVAIIGLIGAIKHHQVLLFFYMIILFILFLVQFILACACLAVNEDQQKSLLLKGWRVASNDSKLTVQHKYNCCGFDLRTQTYNTSSLPLPSKREFHPDCGTTEGMKSGCCHESTDACCTGKYTNETSGCECDACYDTLHKQINSGLHVSGGIGLFFSFTEFIGVILAAKFRNLKDPSADPQQLFI